MKVEDGEISMTSCGCFVLGGVVQYIGIDFNLPHNQGSVDNSEILPMAMDNIESYM